MENDELNAPDSRLAEDPRAEASARVKCGLALLADDGAERFCKSPCSQGRLLV